MTHAVLHDGFAGLADTSVDPVCGMTVDPAKAAGRAEHGGRTYLFCSGHCQSEFQRDPARYAGIAAGAADATATSTPDPTRTSAFAGATTAVGADRHVAGRPQQTVLRRAESGQAKDPVCGMVVDTATALRTARAGRSYYFCSAGCKKTFNGNPAKYAAKT